MPRPSGCEKLGAALGAGNAAAAWGLDHRLHSRVHLQRPPLLRAPPQRLHQQPEAWHCLERRQRRSCLGPRSSGEGERRTEGVHGMEAKEGPRSSGEPSSSSRRLKHVTGKFTKRASSTAPSLPLGQAGGQAGLPSCSGLCACAPCAFTPLGDRAALPEPAGPAWPFCPAKRPAFEALFSLQEVRID